MKRNRVLITLAAMTAAAVFATGCGDKKSETTKDTANTDVTQETETAEAGDSSQEKSGQENGSTAGIDEDQALQAALDHAGITEQDTKFHNVEKDVEDGQNVFEVEFISADGVEYDYELDAQEGKILKFDQDAESQFRQAASADAQIVPESQVMQVVMEQVPGVEAKDVAIFQKEDDGRLEYQAHLVYEDMKYEFKIDPYSGGVIEWEGEALGY